MSGGKIGELLEPNTKTVEWKIKYFFSYTEAVFYVDSPDFRVSGYDFYLQTYPNGDTGVINKDYMSLFFCRKAGPLLKPFDVTIGVKSVQNIITNKRDFTWNLKWEEPGRGWSYFIKRSELLQKKEELVPSGVLTIICTVQVKDGFPDENTRIHKLATDLKDMYISKKNMDVTLEVKGEMFSAHKCILTARSPVFAAMFENNMTEQKSGFIDIPDCDPKAFGVFLLYLYSGQLKYEDCDIFLLYRIADKYDVPELKSLCVNFISLNITIENFCETYVFGHQFQENELLASVQNFFEKKFKEIVSSDSWISLLEDDGRLANNLLTTMAPKIKLEK